MRINQRLFNWPICEEATYVRKCLDQGERIEDVNSSSAFSRPNCDEGLTLRVLLEHGLRGTLDDVRRIFHLSHSKYFPSSGQLIGGDFTTIECILKTHKCSIDFIKTVINPHVRDYMLVCVAKAKQQCFQASVTFLVLLKQFPQVPRDIRLLLTHLVWDTRNDFGMWFLQTNS